jgi:hypothetical protein
MHAHIRFLDGKKMKRARKVDNSKRIYFVHERV